MFWASNPGLTDMSLEKLRNSKPAAAGRTIASAISPAARKRRARRRLRLSTECPPPSRRLDCKLELAANRAGAKPKAQLAMAESRRAKPKTKLSTRIALTRGKLDGRSEL